MATGTVPSTTSQRSRVRTLITTFAGIAAILLLVGIAGAVWFHNAAISSLPRLDGEIKVPGLAGAVSVIRDAQGVPHISAASLEDLFFAQGYVTAQDRLWQMDLNRRYGRGELAEILGARALPLDKRHRILQTRLAAERAAGLLKPSDRQFMEAYARGVNALIDAQRENLPIEFRVLRYEPRPWTVEDSLMIGVNITESLSTEYPVEYAREQIGKKLTPEMTADLYVNGSWRDRPPGSIARTEASLPATPRATDLGRVGEAPAEAMLVDRALMELCDSCFPGSNNWVISGKKSTTGKPLLSNDMHLAHSIPNVWYEVHLRSGDYDVVGVSFPGLPFVVAGHNRHIAWGFTNLGPDVQDLFIENFNSRGEYQTPRGWEQPTRQTETIKVKGEPDVTINTMTTRHGPVVSTLFPGESRQLALQWTLYDPQTVQIAFFRLNSARNWEEFLAGLKDFSGATQNVVYADVKGNIGYHAAGWVPIRRSGQGEVPVPGADGSHDWMGYVPFDKLPSVFNPPSGFIGTANARVVTEDYPFYLANQWGSPYRTERIYKVLAEEKKFSAADLNALQMDTYSAFDHLLSEALIGAVDRDAKASNRAREAIGLVRGWHGRMDIGEVAPAVVVSSRKKLWKLLLEPKLGSDWETYQWFGSSVAMEKLLLSQPARWLPPGQANWDSLLVTALEQAVNDPATPRDLRSWTWGTVQPINIQHPVFGGLALLGRISGPGRYPQSGNGSLTLKAAGRNFGASQRATYDVSNWDASNLNIVTGQSGQIFSDHYLDHWQAWYSGKSFPLPFTAAAVEKSAVHRLTLKP